jgi:hypothetical protein
MKGGTGDVVEANNRNISGAAKSSFNDSADGANCSDIVEAEDGREVAP